MRLLDRRLGLGRGWEGTKQGTGVGKGRWLGAGPCADWASGTQPQLWLLKVQTTANDNCRGDHAKTPWECHWNELFGIGGVGGLQTQNSEFPEDSTATGCLTRHLHSNTTQSRDWFMTLMEQAKRTRGCRVGQQCPAGCWFLIKSDYTLRLTTRSRARACQECPYRKGPLPTDVAGQNGVNKRGWCDSQSTRYSNQAE